ncbi:hypothetical protein E9993_18905 [Labilibacter sediminis]|nr:hypothetical protein E9993_18905 [Labilibacter sediminis]
MNKNYKKRKYGIGVLLLLVGSFLLAGNLGLIPSDFYYMFFRWPSILLIVGIVNLVNRNIVAGLIITAIGCFFLLPHVFDEFYARDILKYWPALLIFAGAVFLFNKQTIKKPGAFDRTSKDDVLQVVSIFGGGVTRFESDNFQGGEIACVFGGEEVNFQNSKLSPQGAVIDITTIFGGTKIMVPRNWNVRVEVISVFGGFSDKRLYEPESNEIEGTLVIKGTAIFGGGELCNF